VVLIWTRVRRHLVQPAQQRGLCGGGQGRLRAARGADGARPLALVKQGIWSRCRKAARAGGAQAAQALGGAVGTAVALRWVPRGWQGRFRTFDRGLKPGVSLAAGAACEGALSFLINLVVLWSLATRCGCTPRCTRAVKSPFCVLPQCACGARRVFMQTEEWACKRRCRPGPPSSALRRRKRLGYVAPLAATVVLARPARCARRQCVPHRACIAQGQQSVRPGGA